MFDPCFLRLLLDDQSATLGRCLALIAQVDAKAPPPSETESNFDNLAGDGSLSSADDLFKYIYGSLRFTGDEQQYYSPDNSLIHKVLDRRKGNPLSLAVVASEIGRRHGVDVLPVGIPGRVLLTDSNGHWFDPFGGGHSLDRTDCRRIFNRYAPPDSFSPEVLAPMTLNAVASRTLANLLNAYGRLGDVGQLIKVTKLQVVASPSPQSQARLVRLLELAGRFEEAADSIEDAQRARDRQITEPENDSEMAQVLLRLRAHRN